MTRTLLTLTAALLLPSALLAAPASKVKAAKKTAHVALSCPVTGEKIASIKDAAGSSVYKGKTYYFCCSSCKPTFDKDPQKYVKTASVPKVAH